MNMLYFIFYKNVKDTDRFVQLFSTFNLKFKLEYLLDVDSSILYENEEFNEKNGERK